MVFYAGKLSYIPSYTVCIYSSGQPWLFLQLAVVGGVGRKCRLGDDRDSVTILLNPCICFQGTPHAHTRTHTHTHTHTQTHTPTYTPAVARAGVLLS